MFVKLCLPHIYMFSWFLSLMKKILPIFLFNLIDSTQTRKNIWGLSSVSLNTNFHREQAGGYEARGGGWANWVKVVKRHKLPGIRWISSGAAIYSRVITVNNTILYIWNLVRKYIFKVLHTHPHTHTHTHKLKWCEESSVLTNLVLIILQYVY